MPTGETEALGLKPVPLLLLRTQISRGLVWN